MSASIDAADPALPEGLTTRPSHDETSSSIAVFDGETLVAYAELVDVERVDAAVLPASRGRGIGTWLAAWLRALGRARGSKGGRDAPGWPG